MFGTGLIVFRETLEAALFVGIVAASTKGVLHRSRWLVLGVSAGAVGSLLMASAMGQISAWADGIGQELVTMGILSIALAMLAWHSIWVGTHAREMVAGAKRIAASASNSADMLWAMALAVAMSVLREGAETVLFVAGLASGSHEATGSLMISVSMGLAFGISTGCLIYAGLGRVKPHHLFTITNGLILMLAGNLASQLARTLNQAGWLTWLGDPAWDISAVLANDSLPGMVLHGVIGYDARPSQLQLLFYIATTLLIWTATQAMRMRTQPRLSQAVPTP